MQVLLPSEEQVLLNESFGNTSSALGSSTCTPLEEAPGVSKGQQGQFMQVPLVTLDHPRPLQQQPLLSLGAEPACLLFACLSCPT